MNRFLDGLLYVLVIVASAVFMFFLLNSHARSQVISHPQSLVPTPVYDCLMRGGSNRDCLKLSRPARDTFIEARARVGISRAAAIHSWNQIGNRKVKTFRCKPTGKEFTCEQN